MYTCCGRYAYLYLFNFFFFCVCVCVCDVPLVKVTLSSCDFASLALTTHLSPSSTPEMVSVNYTFCAIFNPTFVAPPTQSHPRLDNFHPAVYPSKNPDRLGCSAPTDSDEIVANGSLVVDRGICTFYEKAAVAQTLEASMLVVVYNSTNLAIPDLESNSNKTPISIPVLIIGNDSGQQLKVNNGEVDKGWSVAPRQEKFGGGSATKPSTNPQSKLHI